MSSLEAKSFESPNEVRPFTDKGETKIVKLSSGTVGLATFEPARLANVSRVERALESPAAAPPDTKVPLRRVLGPEPPPKREP